MCISRYVYIYIYALSPVQMGPETPRSLTPGRLPTTLQAMRVGFRC